MDSRDTRYRTQKHPSIGTYPLASPVQRLTGYLRGCLDCNQFADVHYSVRKPGFKSRLTPERFAYAARVVERLGLLFASAIQLPKPPLTPDSP